MSNPFSHIDDQGHAKMVDVGDKPAQTRIAIATGTIKLQETTVTALKEKALPKGDVLTVAQIAGIQGAKETSRLIPMCHPLSINLVDVQFTVNDNSIDIRSEVRCSGKTGVEMEALTAVNVAALTIYDMCKAVDKNMIITDVQLESKVKL
tara:strand:- start:867 stop:1316 length:450 start_codon:yes stop_codon:yes gene_type:complete